MIIHYLSPLAHKEANSNMRTYPWLLRLDLTWIIWCLSQSETANFAYQLRFHEIGKSIGKLSKSWTKPSVIPVDNWIKKVWKHEDLIGVLEGTPGIDFKCHCTIKGWRNALGKTSKAL